jgi:hypothetical protein
MTPDERQLITGLFDRMRGVGSVEKDRDAEALISQSVRQLPDASYMLVQSVLVQEQALQQADQRIRELEQQVQRLEAQVAKARPASSSGSFLGLGGLFGGSKPEVQAQPAAGGSVPVTGRPSPTVGGQPIGAPAPSAWGPSGAAAQPPAGGGFLQSAMATAAGVAGGMLLANSIRGMLHASPAKAASSEPAAAPDHPTSLEAHNQAFDANNAGTHDPGIQSADYGANASDWGGGGDLEI